MIVSVVNWKIILLLYCFKDFGLGINEDSNASYPSPAPPSEDSNLGFPNKKSTRKRTASGNSKQNEIFNFDKKCSKGAF